MKNSDREKVIAALGAARMDPYLAAAAGNEKSALALYRWSVELTAAVQEVLGITEVILRNAVDEQLLLPNHGIDADPAKTENVGRRLLGEEAVEKAFVFADDDSGEKTYWRVAHLHELRNRVSHMDSLLNVDVLDRVNDAYRLVGSIDPMLSAWLSGTSTVSAVYKRKPE